MVRSVLLVFAVLAGTAYGQPRAVEVHSTEGPDGYGHPPAALGATVAFGWAGQKDGPSGWSARLEYELFRFFGEGKTGAIFGAQLGFEGWRSGEDNWGFSMPVAFVGGARVFPFRALVGVGVDGILVDQVNDDTGVGFYAPFALAKLGLDVFGFQVGADARIGYRWQFGADDHARWQLGLYAGYTVTTTPRKRALRNRIAR